MTKDFDVMAKSGVGDIENYAEKITDIIKVDSKN